MKKTLQIITAVGAMSLSSSAFAVLVGEVNVGAFAGTAAIDFNANTVAFTPVAPANNSIVNFATGSFVGLLGNMATYSNFTYDPFAVTTGGPAIWRVDADTYFVLNVITAVVEAPLIPSLNLDGNGTLFHNGDSAFGLWSFSADRSGSAFSFSSTNATPVPEGGSAVAMLGMGLIGLGMVRKKLVKTA
ncbi:MAG: hypothetical protein V4675_05145 [Verrucomicrobiota bacterium]